VVRKVGLHNHLHNHFRWLGRRPNLGGVHLARLLRSGAPASPCEGAGAILNVHVRLDKWLWAARFFKTRSLAAQAVDGGKVDLGGERAKRSRVVAVGDVITIRRPPFSQTVVVRVVSGTRGSGTAAATLWEETAESRQARELLAFQLKNASTLTFDTGGRPTKRDRREIQRVRNKWP
jgi:ribosome-associated heat shock protein Hsp15